MNTRRNFILSAAAGAVTLYAAPLRAQKSGAIAGATQVVGVHRRRYGDVRVTALLDGFMPIDPGDLTGANADAVSALLRASFLPSGPVETSINAFVVETAGRTVLVDGGVVSERGAPVFGPTTGKLAAAFQLAGFRPEAIDAVFCTHLHPDHIGFLFEDAGTPRFKNAELVVHEAERAFWSEGANFVGADDAVKKFAVAAQAALSAYKDRLKLVKGGDALAPGLEVMHLPGHTPGHSGLMVNSGDAGLLIWGDVVHVGVCQFARPDWTIGFDVDEPAAALTRKALFATAVTERLEVAGAHIDFPSFGHLEAAGEGVRFTPSRWDHVI